MSLSQNVQVAFKVLVNKTKVIAVARFSDGTKAEYWLVTPFISDMPYEYVEGSAEDANGNPIDDSTSNTSGDDSGESYYFSNYTSQGTVVADCIITWVGIDNAYSKNVVCYFSN